MAIDPVTLRAWPLPTFTQAYDEKDVLLYALGLGIGQDPLDPLQLQFVHEDRLKTLPTMGAVLGFPGPWLSDPATGADYSRVVHGEQYLEVMRPLPVSARIRCVNRVTDLVDRGEGRGAEITVARDLYDEADGQIISRQTSVLIARGDGGFGGMPATAVVPKLAKPPEHEPDERFEWHVPMQAALVYRLSGDRNPLHAVPATARLAGFARPILHGLASFGIAAFAATITLCAGDADRIREVGVRFTAPVLPGDTLGIDFWQVAKGEAAFRAHAIERNLVVLDNGRICYEV